MEKQDLEMNELNELDELDFGGETEEDVEEKIEYVEKNLWRKIRKNR